MTNSSSESIKGYVCADSQSWRNGKFEPVNSTQACFHPMEPLTVSGSIDPTVTMGILPPLNSDEFYQVREEIDKSEGSGRRTPAGNFLNYRDAYAAAWAKGVQGAIAEILIVKLRKTQITALDSDGNKIIMGTTHDFVRIPLKKRLIMESPVT